MICAQEPPDSTRLTRAHVLPFAVFMGFMLVLELARSLIGWDHPDAPWWREDPAQWIYPLQSLVALGLVIFYRHDYTFNFSWSSSWAAIVMGTLGIGIWLMPTVLYDAWGLDANPGGWLGALGVAARRDGFDPHVFSQPAAVAASTALRVIRAVVVVACVEEIFWRGFLMRAIDDWHGDFWRQAFGRPSWRSYLITTGLFAAIHSPPDYAVAAVYGSLTYLLAVWSKSLGACILMHASANLLMAIYILQSGHYGLW